ncbi:hypothetical protein Tco_1200371 [Tanacetum coccineum]
MFTERRDASEYECSSSNSSSNFEFQQMAAALEDKMTLTFRNEMNEMKNMMKAFVPTPAPIKAVEERCTTCGNNHSFNMCPMTRGGYESPVYHDNFQQFQQTASVGNFVQNGNSGYRPPNLANHTHPPGFPSNLGKPSNQGNIPHQMVPYQSSPQNSQIVLANQLDNFKKTTEGSMQAMRNHITNLKAEIRSEVQATLQNQINSLKGEFKNDQPSTSTSMVPTTLPSNTITNPRGEVRAITTRSGLSYTPVPPIPPPLYDVNEPLTEKETEVTKDKLIILHHQMNLLKRPDFHILLDALILMPKYQKMLKSLLSNKEKLNEIAKTPMNANCSAVILKKLPEKLGDPGRFLIPCGFGEFGTCLKNSKGLKLDNSLIILVHGEELVIRDGLERIVFKPDGSQDNESIHMMDVYDDRVKDVCEPESNNDSATSTIVDEYENFFEMNDKKVEYFERKTKEDFETKVEPEKKKELQVFHPDIETLNHFETNSYVGSDYVFYEDFNLGDMSFTMEKSGKIFDPGITFHEKSFEKFDKSSKELAPSKALLTLDVFDPLTTLSWTFM